MPWPYRDKMDPRLEGKSPEDIKKILDDAEAAKTALAAQQTKQQELENKFGETQTSLQAIQAKLNAIEANPRRDAPPPPKKDDDEPADWITDGDKAFHQKAQPIAALAAQTAASVAKIGAQQHLQYSSDPQDYRLFIHWDDKITAIANQTPTAQLMYPQKWIEIYFQVKGQNSADLADPEKRKKNYSFLESGKSNVTPITEEKKTGVDGLTPEELRIATRMGVTPERYAAQKSKIQVVA